MRHYCKEASHLLSDAFERELKFSERLRMRLHLLICSVCRNYEADLKLLGKVLTGLRRKVDEEGIILSDEQRNRISKALAEATSNPDS